MESNKEELRKAFIAGFCTSNNLPDQVILIEGSILKTIHHWFEEWFEKQATKSLEGTKTMEEYR